MTIDQQRLEQYLVEVRPRFEDMLGQAVEIPSVSMVPAHAADIRRMADVVVSVLKDQGAEARIVETDGYPIVSGGWMIDRTYPTVTIYNHLDVQPAQEPEWRQEPFAFRNDDGIYRGRGATDDKGPALTALLAARYVVEQGLRINIRFLWELEEEIGSPHFASALKQTQAVPRPDSVVVSDTIWISQDRPAVPSGLRGLLSIHCSLHTGSKDAHSGLTGGAARNPLTELAELAAACVDAKTGRVKIPGFYQDVVPPSASEMKSFLRSGFNVTQFMNAYGFESLRTKSPAEVMKRIWAMPTFEVHGITGGYYGPGVKTVVPWHGELKASMRLVPNQTPEKVYALFRRFVAKNNPSIVVNHHGMLHPFKGVSSGPYFEAIRTAMRAGFGRDPAFIREGGSIGAVVGMQKIWKVPILFLGLSLPEHGYHAPNEYYDWGQASGGMKAFVAYFAELAKMGK